MRKNAVLKTALLTALGLTAALSVHAEDKVLRIATDATYPPFESVAPDGKLVGIEVEMAQALCNEIKMKCEIKNVPWDGLIPGLLGKKHDAIMASMNITDDRRKVIDFSDVYYKMKNRFIAKKGASFTFTPEGLAGKVIAVQNGTAQDRFVSDAFKAANIQRYKDADQPLVDLTVGRADLSFGNVVQLSEGFLKRKEGQDYQFVGPVFDGSHNKALGEGVAVGMRKEDAKLRDQINQGLAALKANGTFKRIQMKFLGYDLGD